MPDYVQCLQPDQLPLTADNAAALLKSPMLAAPKELRPVVYPLWAMHQHLFPTPLPLTGALAYWCEKGLAIEDAASILRAMCHPESMAKYRFAADMMTDFSNQVAIVMKRRASEARQAAFRERARQDREAAESSPIASLAESFIQNLNHNED